MFKRKKLPRNKGIGIDLGILKLATTSEGIQYDNINKKAHVKRINKQIRKKQRKLSRQEMGSKNREKNKQHIQKMYKRLVDIKEAQAYAVINEVVRTKPVYITVEKLNIKGLMKNRHLSKAIQNMRWYRFKQILLQQSYKYNIEVREVSTWFPSSKVCSVCNTKHNKLKLKDRIYKCPHCGLEIDRDINAAINLANAKEYKVIKFND